MTKFIALLIAIDTAIQHRFDATVHWTMREFGWTKRVIRRTTWMLMLFMLMALGAVMFSTFPMPDALILPTAFVLVTWLYMKIAWSHDAHDADAERSHARSIADQEPQVIATWKTGGLLLMTFPIIFGRDITYILEALTGGTLLFQAYLCRTTPASPKRKEERSPTLTPAPTRS